MDLEELSSSSQITNERQMDCWRQAREAYMRQDWDAAEAWYTKAIGAAPLNAKMWAYRGGVRATRAQVHTDRREYLRAFESAVSDYHRAAELDPDDPEVGVSLVEAEILRGWHDVAAEHAREMLPRITQPVWQEICCWLGAVACELAGWSDSEAAPFLAKLTTAGVGLSLGGWNPSDIENYLTHFAEQDAPPQRVAAAVEVHRIVLPDPGI